MNIKTVFTISSRPHFAVQVVHPSIEATLAADMVLAKAYVKALDTHTTASRPCSFEPHTLRRCWGLLVRGYESRGQRKPDAVPKLRSFELDIEYIKAWPSRTACRGIE